MSPRAKTRTPREMADVIYGINRGPGWYKRCNRCNACFPSHQAKCPCGNPEFSIIETESNELKTKPQNTIADTFANGLKFDIEFRDLIERPAPEELAQLTANLMRDKGARDPIAVWKGHDIVLDGHNRLEICTDNGLRFGIEYIDLPDRDACKAWIVSNQLGRRNLSPARMDYLRGKKLEFEKGSRGGKRIPAAATHKVGSKVQNEPLTLLPPPPPAKSKPADAATRIAGGNGSLARDGQAQCEVFHGRRSAGRPEFENGEQAARKTDCLLDNLRRRGPETVDSATARARRAARRRQIQIAASRTGSDLR